jgi:hypothetical protein
VRRAAVHERHSERRDRLGDPASAREVRLLRVVGVAFGKRSTRLRRQQEDLPRLLRQQPLEIVAAADVGRLDARPARLQPLELPAFSRVPVVRQQDVVAGVERKLRELRADVARPQNEERTFRCG